MDWSWLGVIPAPRRISSIPALFIPLPLLPLFLFPIIVGCCCCGGGGGGGDGCATAVMGFVVG